MTASRGCFSYLWDNSCLPKPSRWTFPLHPDPVPSENGNYYNPRVSCALFLCIPIGSFLVVFTVYSFNLFKVTFYFNRFFFVCSVVANVCRMKTRPVQSIDIYIFSYMLITYLPVFILTTLHCKFVFISCRKYAVLVSREIPVVYVCMVFAPVSTFTYVQLLYVTSST